uniref:Uncharacterized protein n=1 Tax=Bos mutus grunniens TaxID=30521 RepID=A0A8C0A9B3_BOSMU
MGPFLLNAVRWLDAGRRGKIVVQTELRTLSGLLAVGGIDTSIEPNLTSDASVYCFEPVSDVGVKELQEFVAEGGGLFVGAQAWWWIPDGWCPKIQWHLVNLSSHFILYISHGSMRCYTLRLLPGTSHTCPVRSGSVTFTNTHTHTHTHTHPICKIQIPSCSVPLEGHCDG